MRIAVSTVFFALVACGEPSSGEDWTDWYDGGGALDVVEKVDFTDVNYTFTGDTPIADLPLPNDFETIIAGSDTIPAGCADWRNIDTLPREITGIVTLHPRQYIKVSGCRPEDTTDVDSDVRYYGSYFIQDASAGMFVLQDSRVARFDMGDRVTLNVRSIKEFFGLTMIAAHDLLDIEEGPEPIYYQAVQGRILTDDDIGEVARIEGTVAAELGQFGEIYLCTGDDPDTELVGSGRDVLPRCYQTRDDKTPAFKVALDVELQRRGITVTPGERLRVTGPVMYSFNEHQVNVLRVGQLERLAN